MKRREPLPDLRHILEDSRPYRAPARAGGAPQVPPAAAAVAIAPAGREKRIHTRFDKAFLVVIGSELYGDSFAIARNVSAGGILVEMTYAPPLGTIVTVHFQHPRGDDRVDEIVVRSEVKHHHYLNFSGSGEAASTRAIGLRFLEFVDLGERIEPDLVH
ncbi:MAG TPA: hypothetical protein VN253_01805 [Kofleriaceae bacterium]|nr:hypothetical protein [Kofleriaceae bacterium]